MKASRSQGQLIFQPNQESKQTLDLLSLKQTKMILPNGTKSNNDSTDVPLLELSVIYVVEIYKSKGENHLHLHTSNN